MTDRQTERQERKTARSAVCRLMTLLRFEQMAVFVVVVEVTKKGWLEGSCRFSDPCFARHYHSTSNYPVRSRTAVCHDTSYTQTNIAGLWYWTVSINQPLDLARVRPTETEALIFKIQTTSEGFMLSRYARRSRNAFIVNEYMYNQLFRKTDTQNPTFFVSQVLILLLIILTNFLRRFLSF